MIGDEGLGGSERGVWATAPDWIAAAAAAAAAEAQLPGEPNASTPPIKRETSFVTRKNHH
jgi:hypothetical protein